MTEYPRLRVKGTWLLYSDMPIGACRFPTSAVNQANPDYVADGYTKFQAVGPIILGGIEPWSE